MTKIKEAKLKDLIQDDKNFNKGTERGRELIDKSLREFGAGRSLLIDKNNRIIAGNKTHENAEAVGLDDVIIVETDGTKLVAVKRTDIDLDSKKGREMALADNATVKVDLEWDMDTLKEASDGLGIDMSEWDVEMVDEIEEQKEKDKAQVKFTEVLGEEHNYIVLYCDDEVDWLQMQSIFDVGRVRELSTKKGVENINARKIGIGRIMKWTEAYKRLKEHENIG